MTSSLQKEVDFYLSSMTHGVKGQKVTLLDLEIV
jgi:hypothetical protein